MTLARPFALGALGSAAGVLALVAACSSDATPGLVANGDGGSDGASATCAAPGAPTPGTADTHCAGKPAQPVSAASCTITDAGATGKVETDAGADGGAGDDDCEYGATQFGTSGSDDDCKYIVSYTSSPICEGAAGVEFTVTVKNAADGSPVTKIPDGLDIEAYIPTDPKAACDSVTTHPSTATKNMPETSTPGVYKGPIVFDASGQWTVRFHIHEECADVVDDSPHGHIAFRFTVP